MTRKRPDGFVEFHFKCPGARDVKLVGDFTNWLAESIPMASEGNGWWWVSVRLQPGEYRFRYVADDQWYTDFASDGTELNPLGWNSLLQVEPALGEQHKAA